MQTSDQIIKLLDDLSQRLGVAIDWSSQNVMPYLQELGKKYIAYEIYRSWVWVLIWTLCVATCIYCICLLSKHLRVYPIGKDLWYDRDTSANKILKLPENEQKCIRIYNMYDDVGIIYTLLIISCLATLILVLPLFLRIQYLIKCYTIPELVIYEYLKANIIIK